MAIPMIETAEARQNLDDILSVPGVHAIYVGPADLSLALGCKPRLDQTDPPVVEALKKIAAACKFSGGEGRRGAGRGSRRRRGSCRRIETLSPALGADASGPVPGPRRQPGRDRHAVQPGPGAPPRAPAPPG